MHFISAFSYTTVMHQPTLRFVM